MSTALAALAAAAAAAVVTYAFAPLVIRLAHRVGALDIPDDIPNGRKKHDEPTPHLGSIAVFAGAGVGALFLFAVPVEEVYTLPFREPIPPASFSAGILIAFALGVIGVVDDLRPLPASVRLLAQVGAALAAWSVGFRVAAAPWDVVNVLLTLVWIVGITNAFNLLDNMDGLSSGLAGIGALSFSVMGILGSLPPLAVAAAAVAGASLGFLPRNRHPARIFMGDGGALFLGFMLALIGVEIRFENLVSVTFLVPVVVLGLPIFDTTLVVLSRLRHRQPPFTGASDHVSHRLITIGFPVRTAVALLYWCGLCLGWLGLTISRSSIQVGWMLLGFALAMGLFFGMLLWRVPVYEEGAARSEVDA
jgi:UDP-GlcNAc:undecaprenyl-phosphate/decaprenyl-phosphate GlcNAc-1-phosphate transferase